MQCVCSPIIQYASGVNPLVPDLHLQDASQHRDKDLQQTDPRLNTLMIDNKCKRCNTS